MKEGYSMDNFFRNERAKNKTLTSKSIPTIETLECKSIQGITESSPIPNNVPNLTNTNNLLTDILEQLIELRNINTEIVEQLLKSSTNNISPTGKYYDTGLITISVATVTKPDTFDTIANATTNTPGYDNHPIKNILGRNAPTLTLISDAGSPLYVVVTSDNINWSASEIVVEPGEVRTFYDVNALRLRTALANSKYRITEFSVLKPKNIEYFVGNPYIYETFVSLAGTPNIHDIKDGNSTINGASITETQALRRNAHSGEVLNTSVATLYLEFDDENGTWSTQMTLDQLTSQPLKGMDVARIRINSSANGATYRIKAQ